MTTKVPLSMLKNKVVSNIAAAGAGLSITYSDGTTGSIASVGGSPGSTGTASIFSSKVTSGMKAGDIAVVGGVIFMYDGSAWKQVFPAVYS